MMKRLCGMVLALLLLIPAVMAQGDGIPADGVQMSVIQVIIGVLTAFSAGGVIGIAGVGVLADRLRGDTATVTAMEKLAESFPPGTRELLMYTGRNMQSVGELTEEVFDNTPAAAKLGQGYGAGGEPAGEDE